MGFNLQLGDVLRSGSVTAIDDAIREIVRQEIARTPRTKFCDACAYMHQPEISARCCCVACHGDDVPAWAQRMNTPPSIEKTGESASSGSASGRIPVLNADSPASPVKPCPFGPVEASVERFLRAIEARLDVDDDDAHILSRDGLELLKIAWSNRRTPAPSPAYTEPTAKECLAVYAEALTKADVPGSIPSERHRAGIEAVLAFCLNRAPDAEYLKAYADAVLKAHERVKVNLHESDLGIAINEVMTDGLEARVVFMPWDLIDEMRPARKPATVNPGLSETPASKQAAKELDEMLNVFARGDDDGDAEDCWTQPARRARQYVSDLRWELQVTTNRAAILAETNESLRRMIADMAAYAGTTFGADEPVKNAEVVKKALAPSPASGEGARMTTREREEILKNDEIALAIADGMNLCASVFLDDSQPDRRRTVARMAHGRLADAREPLARLLASRAPRPAPQPSVECLQCGHPARAHYAVQRDGFCCAMNECACELLFADVLAGANRRSALPAPDAPKPAIKCDGCQEPLSKVETHSSGIIICKECGGDSTRAPKPASEIDPLVVKAHSAELSDLDDRVTKLERTASEAQGEPPTIEECRAAFDQACEDALKNPRLSRRAADYAGVSAVRALCLTSRPEGMDAAPLDYDRWLDGKVCTRDPGGDRGAEWIRGWNECIDYLRIRFRVDPPAPPPVAREATSGEPTVEELLNDYDVAIGARPGVWRASDLTDHVKAITGLRAKCLAARSSLPSGGAGVDVERLRADYNDKRDDRLIVDWDALAAALKAQGVPTRATKEE